MPEPKKPPTIYDVALLAGVSKSLVSLVLQGDSRVSDARRQAVHDAISQLNYRPSRTAQLLASKNSKTVGVIITEYKNLSFISVLKGMREVFDEFGMQVTVSDLHRRSDFAQDPVDAFLSMNVDALVFICEPDGLRLGGLDVPSVLIGDRATLVPGADQVSNNDALGVKLILNHLVSLGHKKIIHITGAGGIAASRARAYEKFARNTGMNPIIFGEGQPTNEIGGYLAAKQLLDSGLAFTAIWAANDYMAAGAWSAMKEHGLSIPKDVSIAGYDNSPISSDFLLKLSTVDEEGASVGRKAAEIILSRLSQGGKTKPQKLRLKPSLIIRESTGKVFR